MPYPVLTNFDAPNGDASCVRRAASNTPLQALTTLNETVFVECARALAAKTLAEGGKADRDRLAYAFRRCTGRTPTEEEVGRAAELPDKTEANSSPGQTRSRGSSRPTIRPNRRSCPTASRPRSSPPGPRGPRAAEPRRDDHQGVSDDLSRCNHPQPTLAARRWFFQQCGVGLGAIALADLLGSDRRRRTLVRSAGPEDAALSRRRPSGSSTCSWPARRAISNCSTTSRSWRSSTARCRPPNCSRAIAPRSSIPTRSCSARSSSSPSTANAAPSCPSCCRTWPKVVDDIAIVKSMVTDAFNHAPAQIFMNTGSQQFGRPSIGAWTLYGLGSESQDLPASSSSAPAEGPERRQLELGQRLPADGLPGRAVPHQRRPGALSLEPARRRPRDSSATRSTRLKPLNELRLDEVGDPEIATRINSFEMAYRMQTSAPELMDICAGAEAHPRPVRRRAGQAVVRQQLPARPPAGRARRALRAALPRSLGPARQPGRAT